MPHCNFCGEAFEWGFCDGKWVLLEPKGSDIGMDLTIVDEDGELRADHRDRHPADKSRTERAKRETKKRKAARRLKGAIQHG